MPELKLPMTKGDRLDGGVDYRDALPVNAMSIVKPIFASEGYVVSHQGLEYYSNSIGRDRGAVFNDRLIGHFRVSGNTLVLVIDSLPGDQKMQILGSVSGEDNQRWSHAVMPYSFQSQLVVTDQKAWRYTPSTGLDPYLDPNLGEPIDAIWIDGYYFFTDGSYLYHTDINDETTIDPTNYATSEFSPDVSLGLVKTQDNQVMVLNRYTTEYFYDTGASPGFAFQRIPAKAVMSGIVGVHLKVEMGGAVFCLGGGKDESPTMVMITPGQAMNFSTREIDKIIAEYTEKELADDGVMESRIEEGNELIYVRLTNHTLLFNLTASKKFGKERAWTIIRSGLDNAPWNGVNGVYDALTNQWVYGDRTGASRLGYLNINNAMQYGEQQEFILHTPVVQLENASINEMEIQTIPGYTPEDSVTVFFSMTYDGHSWGHEWTAEYGGKDQYDQRFILYRMGYIRNYFAMKLRAVTPARVAFCQMVIEYG